LAAFGALAAFTFLAALFVAAFVLLLVVIAFDPSFLSARPEWRAGNRVLRSLVVVASGKTAAAAIGAGHAARAARNGPARTDHRH